MEIAFENEFNYFCVLQRLEGEFKQPIPASSMPQQIGEFFFPCLFLTFDLSCARQ
jgi:hypothetical protein